MIWKILEIEKTKDEELIKKAYRNKLRYVNPEDDEEGFKELRRAYEEALDYASLPEDNPEESENDGIDRKRRKNDVDLWIDKIDNLYKDVKTRIDEDKWNTLLRDPVCDDLDTEMEAAEKLLAFFMSHSYMPQSVWQLVDKRFGYLESFDQLKEKFPENYLEYIKWQIKRPGFIDYNLFDGKTDANVDDYINKLYDIKHVSEEGNLPQMQQLIKELKRFDVTHPFTETEEARYLLLKAEQLKKETTDELHSDEINELLENALSIMEELDFEYSDNPYIERIYAETLIENGKIDRAMEVYDGLLEENSENYSAMLGKAKCVFLNGDAEEAKEQIEDILEDRVQDADSLALLEEINQKLVEGYEAQLSENLTKEICFKLGWCYYQQKKFEKGIALLDQLGESEEYDYINLRCRLYLANENYDKARPLAEKWLQLIEACEDDGTKEMKKRKNRLSLAHFSIGVCIWEHDYKNAPQNEKADQISKAVSYIRKSIEEEHNVMVRLSYMEQLARFYLETENYDECIEICNDIISRDRGFFPAYVHRQKAHYELKNAKEVIDDYFSCIEIYPQYAPPYVLAAEVFFAFDQYDDVEQVIEAAENAGIKSDSLQLYYIRCMHYKEFSVQNTEHALKLMEVLRDKVKQNFGTDETDIEDLAELEKEYAILHWDLDDTKKALFIIDHFLEDNPDSATMLHLKVDVLNREQRYQDALKACRQLAKLEPDNLYTRNKLGNSYERVEKMDQAVQCYTAILDIDPEYAPSLRRMMYIYSMLSSRNRDLQKCRQAIQYATRFIEVTGSAEGYVERGNLYIDLYELDMAVADCKKAIELDPEAYYAYNNLGCALLKLRRADEAIEPLKKVIEMDPDRDHLPYLNLAECYILKKDYDKAIWAYEEVLRLHPDANHIKKEIVKIYVLKKAYDKAVSICQELLGNVQQKTEKDTLWKRIRQGTSEELKDEEKEKLRLYCDIGDIYRQAGDLKKAEEYYKKVYAGYGKLSKNLDARITEKLAEYYRDSGQLKKALGVMECALKGNLEKNQRNTWNESHLRFVYATILSELGQKTMAKMNATRFIEDLLEKHGGEETMLSDLRYRPMYLYELAIMYICSGDLEKGEYYLEQIRSCKLCVICETCDCFEYYFGTGLIAELRGDKEKAECMYKKAIAIKGDYPCAKRHLDNL